MLCPLDLFHFLVFLKAFWKFQWNSLDIRCANKAHQRPFGQLKSGQLAARLAATARGGQYPRLGRDGRQTKPQKSLRVTQNLFNFAPCLRVFNGYNLLPISANQSFVKMTSFWLNTRSFPARNREWKRKRGRERERLMCSLSLSISLAPSCSQTNRDCKLQLGQNASVQQYRDILYNLRHKIKEKRDIRAYVRVEKNKMPSKVFA